MTQSKKTNEKQMPRRKKRRTTRLQIAVALFVAIVAVSGALAFLLLSTPKTQEANQTAHASMFGVKKIAVVGNTRYSSEEIIEKSGISIGQSMFSVNKVEANKAIVASFPYIDRVEVGNQSFHEVEIRVWEIEPIGAMYANGGWLVVGSNGKAVELLPIEGDRPPRYLYFKGAAPITGKVGETAMDERSFAIVQALLTSMEKYALKNISEIDLTNKSQLRLQWKDQISILLGNETSIDKQVQVFAEILPKLLKNNGETAQGELDMRSYADGNTDNDQCVFQPGALLPPE